MGQVTRSHRLIQVLLNNYQTIADSRFGENIFGFYIPADVGPTATGMQPPS